MEMRLLKDYSHMFVPTGNTLCGRYDVIARGHGSQGEASSLPSRLSKCCLAYTHPLWI